MSCDRCSFLTLQGDVLLWVKTAYLYWVWIRWRNFSVNNILVVPEKSCRSWYFRISTVWKCQWRSGTDVHISSVCFVYLVHCEGDLAIGTQASHPWSTFSSEKSWRVYFRAVWWIFTSPSSRPSVCEITVSRRRWCPDGDGDARWTCHVTRHVARHESRMEKLQCRHPVF